VELLTDIRIVCKMLGTTSRALRFYEEKGLIQSTKKSPASRRQYSEIQIYIIKNVLVLRSLGLSLNRIKELQRNDSSLQDAIADKRAEIIASISNKSKEIYLLEDALAVVESGGDIFAQKPTTAQILALDKERLEIVDMCTEAIIAGKVHECYSFFSSRLCDYLPVDAMISVRADTMKPLGAFIKKEKLEFDKSMRNIICQYLRYTNLGLIIKYVFHGVKIHGLWLDYY
jgi:DNA-binding transcriptional MerR regulator